MIDIGNQFSALTVTSKGSASRWGVACLCGGSAIYTAHQLLSGRRKTCGKCDSVRQSRGVALCSKCRTERPLDAFLPRKSRPSGHSSWCKDCLNAEQARLYREDIGASRRKRRANYLAHADSDRARRARDEHRALKHRVHMTVRRAISRGEIVRPSSCERCPETHRIEAHHDDYSKPLDVNWLCVACHRVRHRELREAGLDPVHREVAA